MNKLDKNIRLLLFFIFFFILEEFPVDSVKETKIDESKIKQKQNNPIGKNKNQLEKEEYKLENLNDNVEDNDKSDSIKALEDSNVNGYSIFFTNLAAVMIIILCAMYCYKLNS